MVTGRPRKGSLSLCLLPHVHLHMSWPTKKDSIPSSSISRKGSLCSPIHRVNSETRRVETPLSTSPFTPDTHSIQLQSAPTPPSAALGAVFYFIELILASWGSVLPLNHRPRCPGQTASGHCWLGSLLLMFTFDTVARVLLCMAPCPLPSHRAWVGGERGPAFKSISYFKYHLFWGEVGPKREWPYCCHMLFNGGWHFICLKVNA